MLTELAASTTRATEKRSDLIDKIRIELKAHTAIEEDMVYSVFNQKGENSDDAKMYFEALEEHRAAGELVLPDLLTTDVGSDQFSGRANVLKDLVKQNADEEGKEIFPRAKKLPDKSEV